MLNEKRTTVLLTCLAVFVILIYTNTLTSPFIFDDINNIQNNASLRLTNFNLKELKSAAFDGPSSNRPVANLSFALNYNLNPHNVVGYHAINILIHILTGLLVFSFVKTTLSIPAMGFESEKYRWLPFFTALIWLVHPIQTQSVTYIVQRMNSMAAMFYVLSILLYGKSRLASRVWKKRTLLGGCIAAGLLALGSKENAATLPIFIILYEWFFFQDLSRNWIRRRLPIFLGIFIFIGILAYVFTGGSPLNNILAGYNSRPFSMGQRVLTEFRVVVFYLGLLVWPHPSRLNLDHDFPLSYTLVNPAATLPAIIIIAGLFLSAVWLAKNERLLAFCILWFLGNLVIESSVIPLEIIFEHRNYLPSMLAVLAAVILITRIAKPVWLGIVLLTAIGILFSAWTWERNQTWESAVTLWRDCTVKSPNKSRPYNNLGTALVDSGRVPEAIEQLEKSLQLKPDYAQAHFNLGYALVKQKELQKGIHHFKESLRIVPDNVDVLNNLAAALILAKDFETAIAHLKKAVDLEPDYYLAHNNLGFVLRRRGNLEEAIYHLTTAVRIKPDFAEAYNNLGLVLMDRGNYKEAGYQFSQAVRLSPLYIEAQRNLNISRHLMRKAAADTTR